MRHHAPAHSQADSPPIRLAQAGHDVTLAEARQSSPSIATLLAQCSLITAQFVEDADGVFMATLPSGGIVLD